MPRMLCGLVVTVVVGIGVPSTARGGPPPPRALPTLSPGLSPREVEDRLGLPVRRSRMVYLHRLIEQWHYGSPHYLRLTFEVVRGQSPTLLRVQSTTEKASRVDRSN